MKAVGIFGGTFDPVHNGHLITAQAVYEVRKLEKIIFIPANVSPHKLDVISSSAGHRLNMLKAAVEGIPHFEVSDLELQSGGISYTVNTLQELKKQYGKIELIIGYDNFLKFNTWKQPDEIIKLALPVVLKRGITYAGKDIELPSGVILLETPLIEISSTDIRSRVKLGLPVNFLVPEKVMEYIYTFNLYKRKK